MTLNLDDTQSCARPRLWSWPRATTLAGEEPMGIVKKQPRGSQRRSKFWHRIPAVSIGSIGWPARPQEFSSCPRGAADRLRAVTICRYLTPLTPPNWPVDERALDIEERSIDSSDLFATKVAEGAGQFLNEHDSEYDEGEHNPFAVFLQDALAKATKSHEAPGSVG